MLSISYCWTPKIIPIPRDVTRHLAQSLKIFQYQGKPSRILMTITHLMDEMWRVREVRCGRAREEGGTPVPRGCAWLERRPSGGHLSGLGRLLPNTPNRRGKPCVQNARQSDKKNNPWSRWRAQRGTTLPRTTSSGHPRVVETQGGECVRWSPR